MFSEVSTSFVELIKGCLSDGLVFSFALIVFIAGS